MSKLVQHLSRFLCMRRCAIAAALLSALVLLPAVVAGQAPSTHFRVIETFRGSNGLMPFSGMVLDTAGNLYGTTAEGGNLDCSLDPVYGCGTLFQIDTTGKEKVLHKFGLPGDGATPFFNGGRLIWDSQGNLYGTTNTGGDLNCGDGGGCGTVFTSDKTGKVTVLYAFNNTDSIEYPHGGVVRDKSGNLYGEAEQFTGEQYGPGVIYKIDKSGRFSVLYQFQGLSQRDGDYPLGGLVIDAAGNLYGVTLSGGYVCESYVQGCGIIFKVDQTGRETVLHRFLGSGDGAYDCSGLVMDKEGNLYGMTHTGGNLSCFAPYGCGDVYRVTKTGKFTTLHEFNGSDGEGGSVSAMVFDAAGNLYGATELGGELRCLNGQVGRGCGVVFKLDPAGKETVLHKFSGNEDGTSPDGVVIDSSGNLYGSTTLGGDLQCNWGDPPPLGCGVVYKITP